jgi:biopolymer transport protein TolR
MGISAGDRRGMLSDVNVVPLIDILLVLLVIFMIIPHRQMGLQAVLPQDEKAEPPEPLPEPVVVSIAADGSLRINQSEVQRNKLQGSLERIFASRVHRIAFLQGDRALEYQTVAQVLDGMHSAGASTVGLLTSELEKNR